MKTIRYSFDINIFSGRYERVGGGGIDIDAYVKEAVKPHLTSLAAREMEDNVNYILKFKKEYWNKEKISRVAMDYKTGNLYEFMGKRYHSADLEDYFLSLKPFDMVLLVETRQDLELEECKREIGILQAKVWEG